VGTLRFAHPTDFGDLVIPGCALLGADPESSTALWSGFRVRSLCSRPGMTVCDYAQFKPAHHYLEIGPPKNAHGMIPPDPRIRTSMRVFNVPASAPFLRTVIAALVDGRLVDGFSAREHPGRLAQGDALSADPACRAHGPGIFLLDVLGTGAVLLPRIVALGDIDEDELEFAQGRCRHRLASLDTPPGWTEGFTAACCWRN